MSFALQTSALVHILNKGTSDPNEFHLPISEYQTKIRGTHVGGHEQPLPLSRELDGIAPVGFLLLPSSMGAVSFLL